MSRDHIDPSDLTGLSRCRARVSDGWRYRQCAKHATKDGWCGTHHPDAEAKRQNKDALRVTQAQRARRRARLMEDLGRAVLTLSPADRMLLPAPIVRVLELHVELSNQYGHPREDY